MMRWNVLWGIAKADARLNRRLVRYWVFLVLAALFAALSYAWISFLFYRFSAYSATIGAMNPRYLFVGGFGMRYAFVMCIGMIFLSFDLRARDAKDRIAEVLDSQPYSNLELVFGRATGMLLSCWVPGAILTLLFVAVGWGAGITVEPLSIVSWLTLQLIPALLVVLALTFFLTLVVRNRLISGILMLVVYGGLIFAVLRTPIWAAPATDVLGAFMAGFPSDLVPALLTPDGPMQRGAMLLIALGLLVATAAIHPRKDDGSTTTTAAVGFGAVVVGAALLGLVVQQRLQVLDTTETWRVAHAEAKNRGIAPDVTAVRGTIDVDPGDRLSLDLDIALRAPADAGLEQALFSFNPGMTVEAIEGKAGPLAFEHDNGLLVVELDRSLPAGGETSFRFRATGVPNVDFAYLDAGIHPFDVGAWDGQVFILGFDPTVFDDGYVALMPGTRWLPVSGAAVDADGLGSRAVDFVDLDVTVRLPEGWTAVLPGVREETPEGQRFAPRVPVPPVALLASEFERRAVEIDGVVAEVLLHRSHAGQFDVFTDAGEEIHTWLADRLEDARDVGLDYPLGALSMVEVPQLLRGFGGGWRMPSTLAPPGAVLVKEAGFPTARLDVPFDDPSEFEDREGGIARAKFEHLERFFENDFTGGNPFVGASRSFFSHQTDGVGPEGLPLDFVFEEMTARLVADAKTYFSVYILDSGMQQVIGQTLQRYFQSRQQVQPLEALMDVVASRPAVWDRLLSVSLVDFDPSDEPKEAVDVLALKGGAMAESMIDELGREDSGRFLAALLDRARGRAFTRDDVVAAGNDVGVDVEPWLDTWLEQTALPGFVAPASEAYRLPDAEDGSPRYQVLVTVANREPVPGLVRVASQSGSPGEDEWTRVPSVRLAGDSAVEVGMVTSRSPLRVRIDPYLSLNRDAFSVPLGSQVDEENIREVEPFTGVRPASWTPSPDGRIVVDDLDDGFAVEDGSGRDGLRLRGRKREDVETDGGIPVHPGGRVGAGFVRFDVGQAYGRYRHTVAGARPGLEGESAVLAAELDRSGPWTLEVHLPGGPDGRPSFERNLGTWELVVEDRSGTNPVTFDAGEGNAGWNEIGTFEVAKGEVRVRFRGKERSDLVVVDAIRWTPPEGVPAAVGAAR